MDLKRSARSSRRCGRTTTVLSDAYPKTDRLRRRLAVRCRGQPDANTPTFHRPPKRFYVLEMDWPMWPDRDDRADGYANRTRSSPQGHPKQKRLKLNEPWDARRVALPESCSRLSPGGHVHFPFRLGVLGLIHFCPPRPLHGCDPRPSSNEQVTDRCFSTVCSVVTSVQAMNVGDGLFQILHL